MGQSIVLGALKAEIPLQNENSLNHQILWQQYMERIESLSPESKVSRFCMEAGFTRVVEVGQYFLTKDTGDFETNSFSGLSRIHSSPRRSSFTTKRMDSRRHETSAGITSPNQFSIRQTWDSNSNLVCWSREFSILGQNILCNEQTRDRFQSKQNGNSCRSTRRSNVTSERLL